VEVIERNCRPITSFLPDSPIESHDSGWDDDCLELSPDPSTIILEFFLTHGESEDDGICIAFPSIVPRIEVDNCFDFSRVRRPGEEHFDTIPDLKAVWLSHGM
jgi:hypothetical protein